MIDGLRLAGLLLAIALVSGVRDGWYPSSRTIDGTERVPPNHSRIDSLITAGEKRYLEAEFDVAESTWFDALALSRDAGDRRSEARVLTWLGLAAYRTGDYADARKLGEEALALKLELGPGAELAKSYNALGLLAWNEGRLLEATHLFDQAGEAARREDDEEIAAKAANNLGLVYSDLGEFGPARQSFQEGLNAGRKLGDAVIEGRTLSNLGMLEIRTGDPAVGIRFLAAARSLYRTTGDVVGEINTLGQLATGYADLGEPRRAFAALDSSLGLARRHDLRSEEASSLELLAALYRDAGDFRRALDLCEEARRLNHEVGLQIEEGSDLLLAAEIHARIGNPARARQMAMQAADLHHAIGATMNELRDLLLLAEFDALLGHAASSHKGLEEARALVHRLDAHSARQRLAMTEARIADRAGDSRTVIRILTDATPDLSLAAYDVLWEAEALRARAHARLGDLDAAAASGFRSVAAIERTRERFGSSFLRTAFLVDRRAVFTDLVDVLLEQGRVEEAFELADGTRGWTLVDRLPAVRDVPRQGGGTVRMFEEGERLLREIDDLVVRRDEIEALPPEERGDAAGRLSARLRQARARYEEVLVRLEESSGEAALLGVGPKVRTLDVQRALQENELLLEYLVTADRVILFEVTTAAVRAHSTPIPLHDLNRRLRVGYELSARPAGSSTSSRIFEDLYTILLGPLPSIRSAAPRHLIVVPDAALDHAPFAALRDPHSGRYLIERHALSYLPSAASLPILRGERRPTSASAGTFDITVVVPLPKALPATREEANGIRRSVRSARLVEAAAATEERVRRELETGRIVHVASHGVLEPSNPLFSRIELFRASDRPADDGRLEIHEVLDLAIRSPLVFLSGCETEASPNVSRSFTTGDEYATLARAFLYSGARTVVATLWRIDDKGAAVFASRYYQHLRELPPSEALARTQRDFLRSERYSEPYFWASYRLAGEGVRSL